MGVRSPDDSTIKLFHIRRITQAELLFGIAVMDFVFHLIDNKDIVSGNPALCFQEEIRFDPFRREPAEPFRLFEIAFLGGYTFQGRVGSLVVTGDIPGKVPAQFLQGVEVPHIKRGQVLHPYGEEPALNLTFPVGVKGSQ